MPALKSTWGYLKNKNTLGHNIAGGIGDMIGGFERGQAAAMGGKAVGYGGGIWRNPAAAMREIKYTSKMAGGIMRVGEKRTIAGMVGKGFGKAIWPALFLYQAATEGVWSATKDAVVGGAMWGAGKWALGRIAAGGVVGGLATAGAAAVIGGRAALIAGRNYNREVRQASFGNAFNDVYGNAATLRQASIQAIQGSKINGRSALGMEANLMHL